MGRRRARAVGRGTMLGLAPALVLAVGLALVPASPAGARAPQPQEIADRAGRAVATEAAQLLALGAFAAPNQRLVQLIQPLGLASAPDAQALAAADQVGAEVFGELSAVISNPSDDVRRALAPLPAADLSKAEAGGTISISSEVYVRALDHLRSGAGAAPTGAQPPDLQLIASWLATLDFSQPIVSTSLPPATSTTLVSTTTEAGAGTTEPAPLTTAAPAPDDTTSSSGGGGGSLLPAVLGVLAGMVVLGGGAWLVAGRRRSGAGTAPAVAPVVAPTVDALLEVSRRLTAASPDEIDRAVVREALGLVPSDGAALVHQRDSKLTIGHESRPGLLVPDELDGGTIRRVADTGQRIVQVSATEPAIRHLPAAVLCVPLVGGGRVEGVLLLVRGSDRPFTGEESALVSAMAPVAAAALHSGHAARAALEDSLVDGLTGVGNRRRFDTELRATLEDGHAQGATTALAIVDLDHFKSVNDTHGHQAGDAVLVAVVEVIRTCVRPQDSVYRFGGEEFCVLMAATDLATAVEVAERMRHAIESHPFSIGKAEPLTRTASFGVSTTTDEDGAALIARADAALYEAKESGRNRVVARA